MSNHRYVIEAASAATTPLRHALLLALVVALLAACGSVSESPGAPDPTDPDPNPSPSPDPEPAPQALGIAAADTGGGDAFEVRADEDASNGQLLVQTAEQGEALSLPFNVEADGEHALWMRVRAPSADADATYVGFDGEVERVYTAEHGAFTWVRVAQAELRADTDHEITLEPGEVGLELDLFAVVADTSLDAKALERHFVGGDAGDDGSGTGAEEEDLDTGDGDTGNDGTGDAGAGNDGTSDDGSTDDGSSDDGSSGGEDRFGSLRGDPGFSRDDLSDSARLWYERLWAAIENPDANPNADRMAMDDDLYTYGRSLHTHLQALLTAFRLTGDLRLLDEVDRLAELMRDELRDEWRDTMDGTDGTADGYLNWVFRYGDSDTYYGKDIHETNAIKVHSIVATIAYALELNRDLESPGGRDYGGHADFWESYLTEHFSPKWREREGEPEDFPYVYRPHTHTYFSSIKYYYYMHHITGEDGYLAEAEREADIMWDHEFQPIDTEFGEGYVWARSVISEGGSGDYLHPTTYARYTYNDFVEFHFEGFHRWADDAVLERFANTLSALVIDRENADGDDWFARDIGGGEDRAGIESSDAWDRMHIHKYARSAYAMIAAWDDSGRVADVTFDVLQERGDVDEPEGVPMVAGLFVDAVLDR